jgi:hypothetical protein
MKVQQIRLSRQRSAFSDFFFPSEFAMNKFQDGGTPVLRCLQWVLTGRVSGEKRSWKPSVCPSVFGRYQVFIRSSVFIKETASRT